MPTRGALRTVAVLALLSLVCACGGGGDDGSGNPPPPPPPTADWYVSATTGNDGNAGTAAAPFKTITYACTQASAGQTIQVLPGTYNSANGETFPIVIPAGVIVLGDEANKGNGATPTLITGAGLIPPPNAVPFYFAAVVPGAGATLAGLRVISDPASGPEFEFAVQLQAAGVTLRNNQLVNSQMGVSCRAGVGNHVILGNVIQGNANGIQFTENSGAGSRVESNVITTNGIGVIFENAGGDLGGGGLSSGGNVLSCNTSDDLWTNVMITINAANNFWDHVPPSGNDITNIGGATIITTGAALAPNFCP